MHQQTIRPAALSAPGAPDALETATRGGWAVTLAAAGLLGLAACQPTVRVEAPKDPITINLNIKLDADVRVRLEEKAREDISSNPDIF